MKKKFYLSAICFLFTALFSYAQPPAGISYQAVIRNSENKLLPNTTIGVKVSILKGSAQGSVVYSEQHAVTTNPNGLMSLVIGKGTSASGAIDNIDWANGPFFVKTETDLQGGSNYQLVGTSQLLSVPFAMYAAKSGDGFSGDYSQLTNTPNLSAVATSGSYNDLTNKPGLADVATSGKYDDLIGIPTIPGMPQLADVATSGKYTDLSDTPALKTVATSGSYTDLTGTPVLKPVATSGSYSDLENTPALKPVATSGSYTDLENKPVYATVATSGNYNDLENTPTIEKQTLSLAGNTLSLTDGGSVNLPGGDFDQLANRPQGTNDGDILYWKNSKWNTLPIGADGQFLGIIDGQLAWLNPMLSTQTTYSVGDVYLDAGTPAGIIYEISTDGYYGKMIALTETTAKWDNTTPDPVATGALSADNGLSNQAIITGIGSWDTAYEAFKYSSDMGAGWYLPAQDELIKIYTQKARLNLALAPIGGAAELQDEIYWSSTENDAAFAWGVTFRTLSGGEGDLPAGSPAETEKNTNLLARPIRSLTWEQITSKPVTPAKTYNIGDIYYDASNQPIGIVCQITNGGINGKMIALEESEFVWDTTTTDPENFEDLIATGATDTENGANNLTTIKAISGWATTYPAFAYCDATTDWYLPAVEEVKTIYRQKVLLNTVLTSLSKTVLSNVAYWTSTEIGHGFAYGVAMETYQAASLDDPDVNVTIQGGTEIESVKIDTYKVRAIRRF